MAAPCPWPGPNYTEAAAKGRKFTDQLTADILTDLAAHSWELYHVTEDLSESHNVAAQYPDKLKEMVKLWWAEAGKYNVLPLSSLDPARLSATRPSVAKPRNQYVYYAGAQSVPACCECAQSFTQHNGRSGDPERRRRGHPSRPRRIVRRLRPLHERSEAPLSPQLRRTGRVQGVFSHGRA